MKLTGKISKSVTSPTIGVGALQSGNTQVMLQEFIVGSDAATLGISDFRWELQRSTSSASGTGVTGFLPLDLQDSSFSSTLLSNLTANGTLTGQVVATIAISEQATFRWAAYPGSEIVIPAHVSGGLPGVHFLTPFCGNTPSASAQVTWEER